MSFWQRFLRWLLEDTWTRSCRLAAEETAT
jgi:hypothetical protein